jgi:nucleotide-binding universal stress UspA family protein
MKIVVGYDGSPAARNALEHAARQAGSDGTLLVVHAYAPPPDWIGHPDYQRILDVHRKRGEALLAEAAQSAALDAVDVETDLLADHPAEAILAAADAHHADEIVVGSRGFGPMRAALGSVGLRVLRSAACPVLVVPAPAHNAG